MSEIDSYHKEIQDALNKLDSLITQSPLYTSNKKKWKDECSKSIQNITSLIQACQYTMSQMPTSSARHYISTTKEFKKKLQQLKDDQQKKIKEDNILSQNVEKTEKGANNTTLSMIQKGDDTHDKIDETIKSMFLTAHEGIKLSDQINEELNNQIDQLDRIQGKVKDTESTLKRAQKSINYFVKALECDKCMLGLILLNLLAIITLIALIVKKNSH